MIQLSSVYEKVRGGGRLTPEEGTKLSRHGELLELGDLANGIR